jgi:hypothetical protein
VFFARESLADIVAAPEHCGAYIKHHARTRVLHPCCDPPTGRGFVESVIARLLSDFRDRTVTRRQLDSSEGAFRRRGTVAEVVTTAGASSVRPGGVVAAPAPVRPGDMSIARASMPQRNQTLQARSKPQ